MSERFQKIYQLGTRYTQGLFDGEVEITEKLDGSQFGFGLVNGSKLICRSRNQELNLDEPERMFTKGVEYIKKIQEKLNPDLFYYAEYFDRPRHNALAYDRTPKNNFALYAALKGNEFLKYDELQAQANILEIDVVPMLFHGELNQPKSIDELARFLDQESYLGGQKIEGIVIKNYGKSLVIGDLIYPMTCAKLVSDAFKEKNDKVHPKGKDVFSAFCESFRTAARWEKALIHLKEDGVIEGEMSDIGLIFKEVHKDIVEEHEDEIKDFLYRHYIGQIKKVATQGLPEWYKNILISN